MRKLILGVAVAACIFNSCKAPVDSKVPSAMDKNKQTALASLAAFNNRDANGIFKDCAVGFIDYGNGADKPMTNLDLMKTHILGFFVAFPDFKGENLVAYADSNSVVVTGMWSGTFKNEYLTMAPTGKTYKDPDADIYSFNKDGKITSHKSIQSEASFFYQLGVPAPPNN